MNPRSILIVEDEIILANDLEARLSAFGYRVVGIACTGRAAIAAAEQFLPDLIAGEAEFGFSVGVQRKIGIKPE